MVLKLLHVRTGQRPDLPIRPGLATVEQVPLARFSTVADRPDTLLVVDIDLRDAAAVRTLRSSIGEGAKARSVFVVDRGARLQEIQAMAIGAGALVPRPVDRVALELALRNLVPVQFARAEAGMHREQVQRDDGQEAIAAGVFAMSAVFDGFIAASPPTAGTVRSWSAGVDDEIDQVGLDRWLATVRNHHGGTYQHCLLVCGIASRFGQDLGLPAGERATLTAAALLHDIGKLRISPALLDKLGPLTDAEFAIFRRHPGIGAEFLAGTDIDPRVIAAVRQHHEYLDGSGYPDGLSGAAITGLSRLLTISDIFAALIEQRSYKLPLGGQEAYAELVRLAEAGKLDPALVRAFRPTAAEVTTTRVTVANDWQSAPSYGSAGG